MGLYACETCFEEHKLEYVSDTCPTSVATLVSALRFDRGQSGCCEVCGWLRGDWENKRIFWTLSVRRSDEVTVSGRRQNLKAQLSAWRKELEQRSKKDEAYISKR